MKIRKSFVSTCENRITELIEQYEEPLLRMCCALLHDEMLAQDAVQETFIKICQKYDTFRNDSSEKTWVMRIAINTCKDMKRSSWWRYVDRRVTLDKIPDPIAPTTSEQTDLVLSIMNLPSKFVTVLLLYYYQDMTMNEIANVLQISQQTVSLRLQKARKMLEGVLKEEHYV